MHCRVLAAASKLAAAEGRRREVHRAVPQVRQGRGVQLGAQQAAAGDVLGDLRPEPGQGRQACAGHVAPAGCRRAERAVHGGRRPSGTGLRADGQGALRAVRGCQLRPVRPAPEPPHTLLRHDTQRRRCPHRGNVRPGVRQPGRSPAVAVQRAGRQLRQEREECRPCIVHGAQRIHLLL